MLTSDFDYDLPRELIAQTPIEPRDSSRLLVFDRKSGTRTHTHFSKIGSFLNPGDLLVRNQTRVLPARIAARKKTSGGKAELLLLRNLGADVWEALVGGKRILPGDRLTLSDSVEAIILEALDSGRRIVRFEGPFLDFLMSHGQMPLPPYIHERLEDPERYQTIYARPELTGSAAAPTAGLHFTERLTNELLAMGIGIADVTLHVGLDTFQPVKEDSPEQHHIHKEWCQLDVGTAQRIIETRARGNRIVAIGTTAARTLESAAAAAIQSGSDDPVIPISGDTGIFILPSYQFRAVDAMVTNFHLPKSTLIMMVSAFADRESILSVYREAIEQHYSFFSFGDAMLIL